MKKSEALDRIVEAIEVMSDYMKDIRDYSHSMMGGGRVLGEATAEHLERTVEREKMLLENETLVSAHNREVEAHTREAMCRQRAEWAADDKRREDRRLMFEKLNEKENAREGKKDAAITKAAGDSRPGSPLSEPREENVHIVAKEDIDAALEATRKGRLHDAPSE